MASEKSMGAMAGRVLLTLIGASGLVVGAFMDWVRGVRGMNLSIQALFSTRVAERADLPATVGFVALVIGIVAIVGLATGGWLTRLAGAVAIVVFVLLIIQLYSGHAPQLPGPGPWLMLTGGMVAAVGGG
ncbi:MAG TPA: hypothetical protein VF660_00085 [Actinomycetota bacterium]|jgi:hypothetical protein